MEFAGFYCNQETSASRTHERHIGSMYSLPPPRPRQVHSNMKTRKRSFPPARTVLGSPVTFVKRELSSSKNNNAALQGQPVSFAFSERRRSFGERLMQITFGP